jgi:hypothetical protein
MNKLFLFTTKIELCSSWGHSVELSGSFNKGDYGSSMTRVCSASTWTGPYWLSVKERSTCFYTLKIPLPRSWEQPGRSVLVRFIGARVLCDYTLKEHHE